MAKVSAKTTASLSGKKLGSVKLAKTRSTSSTGSSSATMKKRGLMRMPVEELKTRLRGYGEKVGGRKSELCKRLRAHAQQVREDRLTVHTMRRGSRVWSIEVAGTHTLIAAGRAGEAPRHRRRFVAKHSSRAAALSFVLRTIRAKAQKSYASLSRNMPYLQAALALQKKKGKGGATPALKLPVAGVPKVSAKGVSKAQKAQKARPALKAALKKTVQQALLASSQAGTPLPVVANASALPQQGAVSPASGLQGALHADAHGVYDCMLTLLDLAQNMDKFYVIQVIRDIHNQYHCFTQWGRTGSAGQSQTFGPYAQPDDAVKDFAAKFSEKTGNDWANRAAFVRQDGLYDYVRRDDAALAAKKNAKWQYYVDDGVDGKVLGWYDYDSTASDIVEALHDSFLANPQLNLRCVQSGHWMYQVDLAGLQQKNIQHQNHTQRNIRRLEISD